MEERFAINLSAREINFVADAIDNYYYIINKIVDEGSRQTIKQIMDDIFMQFQLIENSREKTVNMDNDTIIDVDEDSIEVVENDE